MNVAVEMIDVRCGNEPAVILDSVNYAFRAGACTVVMGFTGSGKSTLLKVAAGLRLPDAGRVVVLGTDLARASERDTIALRKRNGFVFQDAALWANLTVFQNLALPLQFHNPKMSVTEVRDRIEHFVRLVDFGESLQVRPALLSSGERKIVSFIRGIVLEPELLFLDDPTTFVDQGAADRMVGVLRDIKKRGSSIIVATNHGNLAAQLADELIVLKAGRILESGSFHDVTRSKNHEVQFVLSDVLSKTATYDDDLLDLLGRQQG